jgi:nucleoside-diphosphate-sugar epimerase
MRSSLSIAVLVAAALFSFLAPTTVAGANDQKAVLITGATSGIGRYATERLAKAGYFVYAGARKDADMEELNKIDNVMAVRIDVTKQDQIDAAVALVEEQGRGLWGIVNNAGVNVVAPMIVADISDLEFLFDVNVFGVFRVTKAFAPLVIESQGRIFVTAVNPGNYASKIGLTRCKRLLADTDADDWGAFEENPRDRYLVVPKQEEAGWTIAKILEEMLVLNVGHEYSYTRDELIEFIDAYWPFATGEKSWSNETDEKEMEAFIDAWMVKQ